MIDYNSIEHDDGSITLYRDAYYWVATYDGPMGERVARQCNGQTTLRTDYPRTRSADEILALTRWLFPRCVITISEEERIDRAETPLQQFAADWALEHCDRCGLPFDEC